MTQTVHIVAVGARTSLGMGADPSIAAVRAGISGVSEHPFIVDKAADPIRMALDHRLDPTMTGPSRLVVLLETALIEVCRDLNAFGIQNSQIPFFLGLPEERPGWTSESNKTVVDSLADRAMAVDFKPLKVYPFGHASGLMALDAACGLIQGGITEICIVAGVDSYLDLKTLEWMDTNKQLATSYHRAAFLPGEGAGAIAVASDGLVHRFEMESLAVVRGIGTATEPKKIKTDTICLGEGLTESVGNAISSLELPREAVDGIICDINGERYRAEEWGFVILRLPDAMVDPTGYDLPASCWGDVGAASGALFVTLAVTAGQRNWAKGKRYLIWNSSEGGQRAAAVLELNTQTDGDE